MIRPILLLPFVFLSAVFCGPVAQQDAWLIKVVPANEYEGVLEVIVVLDNGSQHSFVLPSTKYVTDVESKFKVSLRSSDHTPVVQMVFLRTHGVCPMGVLPLKVLRIRQLELQSASNTVDGAASYSKSVNDLAVKDLCQNMKTPGTPITDLDSSNADECAVNGKTYQNGQTFNIGCELRCLCRGGTFACVSICPQLAWSPDRSCKIVRTPGQCCPSVQCEDEEPMKKCANPAPTTSAARTSGFQGPISTHQYPWSVWICVDEACSQTYGGVIVGKWHILFFGPDLSTFKNIRFIVGQYMTAGAQNQSNFSPIKVSRVVSHSDFVNTNSPIADSAPRLQILHTNRAIPFTGEVQPANVPLSKTQCAAFTGDKSCPLRTVGWDIIQLGNNQAKREWFLHAEDSKLDSTACNAAAPKSPRGAKRACVAGLQREDCTGPRGGAVVASAGKTDFVCGLLDMDADMVKCEKPGTATMLPLCKYIDWIASMTTAAS